MKSILKILWDLVTTRKTAIQTVITETGYSKEKEHMQRTDENLTPHFPLFEMTRTDNVKYQTENRNLSDEVYEHLHAEARLMEQVRFLCGDKPVIVHSAYRCPALNGDTPGASITSQHPMGEACDFHVQGQAPKDTFEFLRQCAKDGRLWFGQLIYEVRGEAEWVHISLGDPYRPIQKCGQVMISPKAGVYELLEIVHKPQVV